MVLDEQLLEQSKMAREKIAALERESAAALANYHRAIRRLYVAGSSMREIAGALQLSHQRVHQIVEAGEGLRRRWKLRRATGELSCTFCRRSEHEVSKLIAGARAFICGECIEAAAATFDRVHPASTLRCSFCTKPRKRTGSMMAGERAQICDECLRLCGEIAGPA